MSYIEDKNFSSVFGNAADNIEFDKVLEADEEDELIETVLSLSEVSDDNDDFHETTGENDKDAEDIEDELQGQPDSGDNSHTDSLDIDLSEEAAFMEAESMSMSIEAGTDFAETTGENDKSPEDIKKELEGRPDSGCNKHTGTFDPVNGSNTFFGNYRSVDRDLDNMGDAASRASSRGEDLYTSGKLSTEAASDEEEEMEELETESVLLTLEIDVENGVEEGEDPDPGYDMDDYDGQEDYVGVDVDYDSQEDYGENEDWDGVAESSEDEELEDDMDAGYDYVDYDDLDESAVDDLDDDEDDDLIDAADEDDGEMSAAEVEALVAAGGDDDIIDSI